MSGSADAYYIIWNSNGTVLSSGLGANGNPITIIKQTGANKLVIGSVYPSIIFYDISNLASPTQTWIGPMYLTLQCNSICLTSLDTIFVASESPSLLSFQLSTNMYLSMTTLGSINIKSLEYLSKLLIK